MDLVGYWSRNIIINHNHAIKLSRLKDQIPFKRKCFIRL